MEFSFSRVVLYAVSRAAKIAKTHDIAIGFGAPPRRRPEATHLGDGVDAPDGIYVPR